MLWRKWVKQYAQFPRSTDLMVTILLLNSGGSADPHQHSVMPSGSLPQVQRKKRWQTISSKMTRIDWIENTWKHICKHWLKPHKMLNEQVSRTKRMKSRKHHFPVILYTCKDLKKTQPFFLWWIFDSTSRLGKETWLIENHGLHGSFTILTFEHLKK